MTRTAQQRLRDALDGIDDAGLDEVIAALSANASPAQPLQRNGGAARTVLPKPVLPAREPS